jgi:hypothetical protein
MSFYFSVYFEGSPPLGINVTTLCVRLFELMPRGGDHPIFKCSHVPIKRQSFMCMEVPVLIGSPEVWNTLRWPSLRRTHLYRNLQPPLKPTSHFWLYVCSRHLSNLTKNFGELFNTLWARKLLDLISYFPCLAM